MALASFPDGDERELDESMARHMQVGDTVLTPIAFGPGSIDGVEVKGARVGVVTKRIWHLDGALGIILTDPAPPVIEWPGRTEL